ncbi:hypothetical protein FAI41_04135 [Acetobacteraceae bacterium]|nr:hypothetical protein FAI41_04135 [Acetobacteraceae bacterium]
MEKRDQEIEQTILNYLNDAPIDKVRKVTDIFNACGGGETIDALRALEREGKVTRINETEYKLNQ